ncbi:MAG: ABC transporter substrate-binding protein [Chloroflexi bacterium]|nr:ABC transporter substrate-binding protein [Chloroflexota bacterium]
MWTRRLFISCLTVLGLLVASCSVGTAPETRPKAAQPKPASSPAAPAGVPKAAVGEPRYGGTLSLTGWGDPPHLDLHTATTNQLLHPIMPVYSGLVQYDPLDPSKIIGDLAEKWDTSPDGKVLTFNLPRDVRWHDGKPFSSADARFSLERMRDPKTGSPRESYLWPVEKFEAPDANTLKITLKYPFNLLPLLAVGWMLMLPKHMIETKGDMKRDVLGTGPFKFKEYSAGVLWQLEKNKEYFVKGRPYVDKIVTYIIKDPATRLAAITTGQVHLTSATSLAVRRSAMESVRKSNPGIVVHKFDSVGSNEMTLNHKVKPWDDIRVRRAADLAIDRQAAMKVLGEGDGFLASWLPYWGVPTEDLVKRPGWRDSKDADRAEAKKLMSEAGYSGGFKTKMLSRTGGDYEKLAQFIQAELRTIGIEAAIDLQDSVNYLSWPREGKFEHMARTAGYNIYDPYETGKKFLTDAAKTVSAAAWGYSSPKYDDLFTKQGGVLDPTERKTVVREMDELLLQEVPNVLIMWRSAYVLASPKLRNYKPGNGDANNFRSQDVWLAE